VEEEARREARREAGGAGCFTNLQRKGKVEGGQRWAATTDHHHHHTTTSKVQPAASGMPPPVSAVSQIGSPLQFPHVAAHREKADQGQKDRKGLLVAR
jgi:hypothetical protein